MVYFSSVGYVIIISATRLINNCGVEVYVATSMV